GVVSRTGLDSIVSQFSTEFPDWCCAPAPMDLVYERIVNYRGGVRIERPIFRVIPSRKMPLGPVRDRSATGKRRMEGSNDLGRLDSKHWSQLQDLASRFEAAWKKGDTVDLTAFLPPVNDPLRPVALHELIKTDLEARWRRDQVIGIEAYLEKFPELGDASSL